MDSLSLFVRSNEPSNLPKFVWALSATKIFFLMFIIKATTMKSLESYMSSSNAE